MRGQRCCSSGEGFPLLCCCTKLSLCVADSPLLLLTAGAAHCCSLLCVPRFGDFPLFCLPISFGKENPPNAQIKTLTSSSSGVLFKRFVVSFPSSSTTFANAFREMCCKSKKKNPPVRFAMEFPFAPCRFPNPRLATCSSASVEDATNKGRAE